MIIKPPNPHYRIFKDKCDAVFEELKIIGVDVKHGYSLPISYQTPNDGPSLAPGSAWTRALTTQALSAATPPKAVRLCRWSNNQMGVSAETCCNAELEGSLLQKTVQLMKQRLSTYLNPWIDELLDFRNSLRDQLFDIFESSRDSHNTSLCGSLSLQEHHDASLATRLKKCWQMSDELFSKYRLTVEQFIIGPGDIAMDISMPIDNLLMQLVIDISCPPQNQSPTLTLEEFNQEIRCHKICQSRLNLILDSVMMNGFLDQFQQPVVSMAPNENPGHNEEVTGKPSSTNWGSNEGDVYRLLYSPELLFSIRLNRVLVQALDLGESLLSGLKAFNSAQGTCIHRLMRMHFCSLCAGEIHLNPCPGLCNSVLSSCLGPLTELSVPWIKYTDAVKLVANMLIENNNLTFIVQFNLLPNRMVTYFRRLLERHQNWLQPQCAGTTKVLSLMELGKDSLNELDHRDASELLSIHSGLLDRLSELMNRISRVWSDMPSSICSQPPFLIPGDNKIENCWNGSARGRFDPAQCDFCGSVQSHAEENRQTKLLLINGSPLSSPIADSFQLGSTSRKQRTSSNLAGNQMATNVEDIHPSNQPDGLTGQGMPATWLSSEDEIATRQANELLVRASRDLQWAADSLMGELQSYVAVVARANKPDRTGSSHQNGEQANFARASEPMKQGQQGNQSESQTIPDYGSMHGLSLSDIHQVSGPIDSTSMPPRDYVVKKPLDETRYSIGNPPSQTQLIQNENSVPGRLPPELGSGYPPEAWRPDYIWQMNAREGAHINLPGLASPNNPSVAEELNQQFVTEGSGGMPVPSTGLPLYLDYADYPQFTTLNHLWNKPVTSIDGVNRNATGSPSSSGAFHTDHQFNRPLPDDEDYTEVYHRQEVGTPDSTPEPGATKTKTSDEIEPTQGNVTTSKPGDNGQPRRWTDMPFAGCTVSLTVMLFSYLNA